MQKKIVILSPHGHRLANQLWNFASVYAYCLEKDYLCENPSFFRYYQFFNTTENTPGKLLSLLNRTPWQRVRGWSYLLFERYVTETKRLFPEQVISDKKEPHVFYLPPSKTEDSQYKEMLSRIDTSTHDTFYFAGWLFRNPVGLEKYRKEIQKYFAPKKETENKIADFIIPLREKYTTVVGVHIRQGDYIKFQGGKLFLKQEELRKILDEYLEFFKKNASETIFIICSDGPINAEIFEGLHASFPDGNPVEDLFTLASADAIIGSNSTFGAFASYYGNIPFIVLTRDGMDWEYYRDKNKYFENKKSTFVFY